MTDEIDGRRVPQCPECLECLESLDWRLAVAWSAISFHGSMRTLKRLRVMDELVDELPDVPDVTAAREELQRRLRALDDE
ncbi:MAG: hypothetical protein GY719_03475 [bacterium]|nr:hypothetical protein [bacterium]